MDIAVPSHNMMPPDSSDIALCAKRLYRRLNVANPLDITPSLGAFVPLLLRSDAVCLCHRRHQPLRPLAV